MRWYCYCDGGAGHRGGLASRLRYSGAVVVSAAEDGWYRLRDRPWLWPGSTGHQAASWLRGEPRCRCVGARARARRRGRRCGSAVPDTARALRARRSGSRRLGSGRCGRGHHGRGMDGDRGVAGDVARWTRPRRGPRRGRVLLLPAVLEDGARRRARGRGRTASGSRRGAEDGGARSRSGRSGAVVAGGFEVAGRGYGAPVRRRGGSVVARLRCGGLGREVEKGTAAPWGREMAAVGNGASSGGAILIAVRS